MPKIAGLLTSEVILVIRCHRRCCYLGLERVHRISCCVNTNSFANVATLLFVRDKYIGVYLVNESLFARSTLLATALVNVRDTNGKLYTMRAMIDPCYQCKFVFDSLCKKLQLSTRSDTLAMSEIGGNLAKLVKGAATMEFYSVNMMPKSD